MKPNDILEIQRLLFEPLCLPFSKPIFETESKRYNAAQFSVNRLHAVFRSANITPTKTGQFVTLWKRTDKGQITPFDLSDPIDIFIISTRAKNQLGIFVFPKSIFSKHNIISHNGQGGKRAIRVYPAWDTTASRQAQMSQQWQLKYFLQIPENGQLDRDHVLKLFH